MRQNDISEIGVKSPVLLTKDREPVLLPQLVGKGGNSRSAKSAAVGSLWFDTATLGTADLAAVESILGRIVQLDYTAVVLHPQTLAHFLPRIGKRLQAVLSLDSLADFNLFAAAYSAEPAAKGGSEFGQLADGRRLVIASADPAVLAAAQALELATCLRAYVDDGQSLHAAIARGQGHDFLLMAFRDPTNIPLELVIASLQPTNTVLIKAIDSPTNIDDAIVTLGVMEVGAEGVMYSPRTHGQLDEFLTRLAARRGSDLKIEVGTVVRSLPIGMGHRSCIDLTTMFQPTEGMLVGSTSQGGVLCCPEVFFLPYMELRPFRVNAGAVHSYVYNFGDRTDYMSELKAGTGVMIVGTDGKARRAAVGRIKTEVRPLRLIEVQFASGELVNVIMQDDWHVRIFSADSKPLNITDLKPGDKVLGHVASPGRHVGIKVEETILEN